MEELVVKYGIVLKALNNLNKAIEVLQPEFLDSIQMPDDYEIEDKYRVFRDSAVKRFEIIIDTLWKYLKLYLSKKYGVVQNSPKSVIRECFRIGEFTNKEIEQALEMVDARNMTSHIYKEEIAEQISGKFVDYYKLISKFVDVCKP